MKTYLAILIFVCIALIPPIDVVIKNPPNPYWLWMILIAGFLGIFTLFIKTYWPVRVIAIGGFIHCFFSAVPYISFTSYVSLVACCYFYILCSRITDWKLVFKAAQTVVIINVILMAAQMIHKDNLLNFGNYQLVQYGTIGYHMWMASFGVILGALLLPFSVYNFAFPFVVSLFCNSTWTFLCTSVGIAVYLLHKSPKIAGSILLSLLIIFLGWATIDNKIVENMNSDTGREAVWSHSIKLANVHPIKGWGIGTYKDLFFGLSGLHCMTWKTAHNFIIQLCFEIGYPLTGCLLFALGWLSWALYKAKLWLLLSGFVMIILDGQVHFPDRMIQTVPLIIVFLAYMRNSLCQTRSLLS